MSSRKKRAAGLGRTAQLTCDSGQALLVDHFFDDISDDRQLKFLPRISLIHKEYPNSEDSQSKKWEDSQCEEPDDWNVGDHKPDNPQREPKRDNADVESNGLRAMKFYEGALVD